MKRKVKAGTVMLSTIAKYGRMDARFYLGDGTKKGEARARRMRKRGEVKPL